MASAGWLTSQAPPQWVLPSVGAILFDQQNYMSPFEITSYARGGSKVENCYATGGHLATNVSFVWR